MAPSQNPYQPYADLHKTTNGAGDQRPTCAQILKDCNAIGSLKDHTIMITGCSAGIGIETAKALYETGARVVLTARDMPKGQSVIDDIVANASNKDFAGPEPELLELHLDSLASVRSAATEYKKRFSQLNILITNAGVMACPYALTEDGFEKQFGTNHLAHFLLFQLLKPLLLSSAKASGTTSRVITVSSSGHRASGIRFDDLNFSDQTYDKWLAYGQSKTANIYMASSISRHYASQNLIGLSLHPGVIMTELARYFSDEDFKALNMEKFTPYMKSPDQGAATSVWAAVSPHFEGGKGGVYLSDCGESPGILDEGYDALTPGHAKHVFDEEAEERLWKVSCELVGVDAED